MTLEEFFQGYQESRLFFDAVREMLDTIGLTEMRISKSQIAFWRSKAVARVWIPARYLKGDLAPLVLTLGFTHRDESPRWKEIVEPAPGHFTHHLEIWTLGDLDEQVRSWLEQAWIGAA
jgi:hypothetical protein